MDLDVMANEEWETIKDFPNYQVSTFGNIRSVDRISVRNGNECHLSGMLLKPRNVKGYLRVVLYNGTRNKKKAFLVHRLVADAFLDNPTQLPCVNHKDENGLNNRLDNWNGAIIVTILIMARQSSAESSIRIGILLLKNRLFVSSKKILTELLLRFGIQ